MPKLDENNQLINQQEDNLFWSKIANVDFFIIFLFTGFTQRKNQNFNFS